MLSFNDAVKILGSKQTKKIGNNTVLSRAYFNTSVMILLHGHPIIYITKGSTIDGDIYSLDNCGFKTVTTKRRINKYGPVRVYQKDFIWHTKHGEFDSCKIFYSNGKPVNT